MIGRELYWNFGVRLGAAAVAVALVATAVADIAGAQIAREPKRQGQGRAPGKPLLAVVALAEQRIKVYDANGLMLEAPVSTGATTYETPAGIFSIVQKKETHHSNLYEDGEMPFMQRITWTGIALHAGALPGHPASHGCIRLQHATAQRLFDATDMGMRVVVVREDMAPTEITHPVLFKAKPAERGLASFNPTSGPASDPTAVRRTAVPALENDSAPGSPRHLEALKTIAAAKASEALNATKREREVKAAAARLAAGSAAAERSVRAAESDHAKAEAGVQAADRSIAAASSSEATEKAEAAKSKALSRLAETQAKLESAKLDARSKKEAAERASEDATAAGAARNAAAEAAQEASRNTFPVSVFISLKAQRLYIRKGTHPVFEGPVMIRDADRPIGTFVYTALSQLNAPGEMRWNVVSMYKNPTNIPPAPEKRPRGAARNLEATGTDPAAARAALDRIEIPPDALERISQAVLPGSSLIISDEAVSRETGKDTDFVVVMSGEPQGALKVRQREPMPMVRNEYPFGRPSPRSGGFFFW